MRERFLEGRTALVTGSVQGIGLAIGKALASAGARLAVHGIATRELAQTAVQMMRDTGAPDARFFDADMREPSAIIAMMDEIKAWGGPDILVNNAGIQETASLAEVTQQTWDDILAVNLSGAFHTMRRALPEMAKRGYGRVVNIASVHGLVASVNKARTFQRSSALSDCRGSLRSNMRPLARAMRAGSPSTASALAGPRRRSSNRRFRREQPRSAVTVTVRFPACSPKNSQAGERRGQRKSDRSSCGSPTPRRTISPVLQSRLMAAGQRNSSVNCPLMTHSGPGSDAEPCLLSGAKRT